MNNEVVFNFLIYRVYNRKISHILSNYDNLFYDSALGPAKLRDSIQIGRSDSIRKSWADLQIFESAVPAHCSS